MLICSECGKTIANTNPRVHYGICANCPMPERLPEGNGEIMLYETYKIAVEKKVIEFYEVLSESEEDAIDNYGSGRLINTHSIVLDVKNKESK
jgi:hypothetical protein